MTTGHPASPRQDGHLPARLYPGWEAGRRHHGPAGLDVLLLHESQTGRDACWWLSGDGELLACHALALPPQPRAALMEALTPALGPVSASLLSGEAPLLPADTPQPEILVQLAELPLIARLQLLSLWFQQEKPGLCILSPTALLEDEALAPAPEDAAGNAGEDTPEDTRPFSPTLMKNLLGTRPAGPHTLTCSPLTGRTLRAGLTMPTAHGAACRFSDEEKDGIAFYLFWSGPAGQAMPVNAGAPLFYYPAGNLLVGEGPFTPLIPVFLLSWFITNPGCVGELQEVQPFRLEDYGVGHASALWDNLTSASPDAEGDGAGKAGQTPPSFPFSTSIWKSAPPPGGTTTTNSNAQKGKGAGDEKHDPS